MSTLCKDYRDKGKRTRIITSAPSFIHGLVSSKNWLMVRKPSRMSALQNLGGSNSSGRLTATFEFVG